MPNTDEVGLTIPVIDDAPNVPDSFGTFRGTLKPQIVPRFGSTGARDAAFTAGQFRLATVGNVLYMRRGSAWTTMLADEDVNTPFIVPTMNTAGGWSALVADPCRFRITAGKVEWRGVAYNSGGVPGNSSILTLPTNALPGNAAGWDVYNYAVPCVATPLASATPNAFGFINLRGGGSPSLTCYIPGGIVAGATKVSMYNQGWFL